MPAPPRRRPRRRARARSGGRGPRRRAARARVPSRRAPRTAPRRASRSRPRRSLRGARRNASSPTATTSCASTPGRRCARSCATTSGTPWCPYGTSTPQCSGSMARPGGGRRGLDHLAARRRLRGRREARQPAVGEPADASQLTGGAAAEPDVRRLLHRADADADALVVEVRAVVVDGVLGPEATDQCQRPRRRVRRAPRGRRRTPAARPARRRRGRTPGAPGRRTADRGSPTPSASRTGLRPGRTCTLVPSLRRCVRPAATASATSGSGIGPVARSESHSESKPRSSRASTSAPKRSPSIPGPRTPSP